MNAGDLCNREVITVDGDAKVIEAAHLMREHHVGDLVVVKEGSRGTIPIGILTDRDIVISLIARDIEDLRGLRVRDVLADELVTADEFESVADVVKRMRAFGIRRIPVLDDHGCLAGVLAFDDVVDFVATLMDDLSALVGRQLSVEMDLRD